MAPSRPLLPGPRIAIVGGSMAGLFAAVSLRAQGYSPRVYERARVGLANRGAGVATHSGLYVALQEAGIDVTGDMGVASAGRLMLDASGAVVGALDSPQVMTSWGLLYRLLRSQFDDDDYHCGFELCDIVSRGDGLQARFTNGEAVVCDYLIAADGPRSTVRRLITSDTTLEYCGYFAWRGMFDESLLAPDVFAVVGQRMTLNMATGGHWLGYLVPGSHDEVVPGRRLYNWGWYRTADESLYQEHLTDEEGNFHAQGIPHHLVQGKLIDMMREQAREALAPLVQSIIDTTPQPFLQGIYEVGCKRLIHDRVIVIGDAAFTARPHVGLGVSKAAEDATTLALAFGDDAKMQAWEGARLAYGNAVVAWGRDLGSYCGPPPRTAAGRAKATHHRKPAVLLAETGASEPDEFLARYARCPRCAY